MKLNANVRQLLAGASVAAAAMTLPAVAQAQAYPAPEPMSPAEVETLPPEYQTAPVTQESTETTVGPDGVEVITRTRRIERSAPYPGEYQVQTAGPAYPYAPAYAPTAAVFEREQWLEECDRRTNGRDDREKGGIIGTLLGAITGGIIGNRVADAGDRLGGTLIGAGVGGLSGLILGNLIGGGRNDRGEYDCEAALDSYLSQYGYPGAPVTRVAARVIPAPAYGYAPAYAPPVQYGYGYAPAYSYTYAPPPQIVYVPVQYEQQQRVIVRETIREETVPGAARVIPPPPVTPVPQPPRELQYIKGN